MLMKHEDIYTLFSRKWKVGPKYGQWDEVNMNHSHNRRINLACVLLLREKEWDRNANERGPYGDKFSDKTQSSSVNGEINNQRELLHCKAFTDHRQEDYNAKLQIKVSCDLSLRDVICHKTLKSATCN